MDKIFINAVRLLFDPQEKSAPRPEADITSATLSGSVIKGRATCTSSNFKNNTFNLKFTTSGEIRTIHACLLTAWNGREVML
jgi:hypothetical protein